MLAPKHHWIICVEDILLAFLSMNHLRGGRITCFLVNESYTCFLINESLTRRTWST